MDRMTEAKREYLNIPIPQALSKRVMLEVERAEKRRRFSLIKKRIVSAAAAVVILFVAGLNTSEVFAGEMNDIPVIGTLAKIFTIRSYETETEEYRISVDIPSVAMIEEDLGDLEKEVNEDIYAFCEQYAGEAEGRALEYRQAFLDTGGTKEEWAEHEVTVKVWYEVKAQTDRYLSLIVKGTESWVSAYSEERYYNLDMETGKWVTLRDILGDDYARIARQSILSQIEQRQAKDGMEYWADKWTGIDDNTKFYMNQDQNPVIILEKYAVAPGGAGQLEFEIDLAAFAKELLRHGGKVEKSH